MTDSDKKNIYQRMVDINGDASGLEFVKSKFVEVVKAQGNKPAQGYYVIPISDILNPLRKLYAKHGLFIQPSEIKYNPANGEARRQIPVGQFKEETWVANGHVDFTVYSVNGEIIETSVSCESTEKIGKDKLTNKLYTNAIRNYLRLTHMIDGDEAQDPEEVNGTPEPIKAETTVEDDPLFSKGKKEEKKEVKEPERTPEKKTEISHENPAQATENRDSLLKEIEEHVRNDPSSDWIARSFLGKKKTYSELPTDTLSEIVKCLRGA